MNEVYKNIFQIDIPLFGSPLKLLHAYLIRGIERNLLIDTGFNHETSKRAMFAALKELDVSLDNTDMFITHAHADHGGLVGCLKNEHNVVYCSESDGNYLNQINSSEYNQKVVVESKLLGIPDDKKLRYTQSEESIYISKVAVAFQPLVEGDTLRVGEYSFQAVDLSGHTPGQLGLYEPSHKILFCGDHILCDITPNIVVWYDEMDSIQVFTDNLKKVRNMDMSHVFPAHRSRIADYKARIDELLRHHENRCREIMDILKNGAKSIYAIALEMSWDFGGGEFIDFPPQQIWFASSEAYAHAEHLLKKGKVTRSTIDGEYIYRISDLYCSSK